MNPDPRSRNPERDAREAEELEKRERDLARLDSRIEYLNSVLREVQDKRTPVVRRIRELRRRIKARAYNRNYNTPTGKSRGGIVSEYVLSSDLKPYLDEWIERFDLDHGRGGVLALCSRTGLNARALWRIRAGRSAWTTFEVAEELMLGIDLESLLGNEIPIRSQEEFYAFYREAERGVQEDDEGNGKS